MVKCEDINILFWNIRENPECFRLIIDAIEDWSVDICAIAEMPEGGDEQLHNLLSEDYSMLELSSNKAKVKYAYRSLLDVKVLSEFELDRASILQVTKNKLQAVNVVGCHLYSQNQDDEYARFAAAERLSKFVSDIEGKTRNKATVIIGDFNMNPFEAGMTRPTALNSVMNKRIAAKQARIHKGTEYSFFYNPMWYFLGHPEYVNGTLFYDNNFYWNMFDQVLLRPELSERFTHEDIQIVTKIQNVNLLTENSLISKMYSDHLPILLTLKL